MSIKWTITTFPLMIVAATAALLLLLVALFGKNQVIPIKFTTESSSAPLLHPITTVTAEEEATRLLQSLDQYYSLPMDENADVVSPSEAAPVVDDETVSSFSIDHRRSLARIDSDRSIQMLKQKFQVAKAELESQLKVDYGEEAYSMLFQTSDKKTLVAYKSPSDGDAGGGPSWDRMVRRLVKKIVKSQLENRNLPFIWSTGGHSAAAGHGNFYSESYTAVFGRNALKLFAAVGLDLQSRNYAMGGTSSSLEVASCIPQIFGNDDIDVLSWDFGMTDGRTPWKPLFYFYRANQAQRPACIGMHMGRIWGSLKPLEERGMTTLFGPSDVDLSILPDSEGKTEEQLAAMPKFIQAFRCGNTWEKGSVCGTEKWTHTGECDHRRFQTSWHPGKDHALKGNQLALFMMEVIHDALQEIETKGSDPNALLVELQKQEDADYKQFKEAELPDFVNKTLPVVEDVPVELLFKEPNMCHTARLPAETRFKGILTESDQTGFETYDKGMPLNEVEATQNPGGKMRLTYDPNARSGCTAEKDFKDYYYISQKHEGVSTISLPNAREKAEYGTGKPLRGIISICFAACSWGKCPKGSVNRAEILNGDATLTVNGQKVVNLTEYAECPLLRGDSGHVWPSNGNGQYDIGVEVHSPVGGFVRISSIMIW